MRVLDFWAHEGQPASRSQDVPAHVKAVAELWPIVERTGAARVIELGAGECPTAIETMLAGHGIATATLDCNSEADIRGDMHELPIKDKAFDLAIARHSLEHCVAPYLALQEMMRVARWGLVVVPEDSDKFRHWQGHLSVFPRGVWERMFRILGLRIAYFEYGDFTGIKEKERNVEWRYLLERCETILGPYEKDGHCVGVRPGLARRGWQ